MEFRLEEQGHLPTTGAAFQRYRAVSRATEKKPREVSIREWCQAMLADQDDSVLQQFLGILRRNSYRAFFFETRPVTALQMASKTFEFVLVDAPQLAEFASCRPNPWAFAEHFGGCSGRSSCVFPNSGGDATLIAPKYQPKVDLAAFSHLADFCRCAPADIVMQAWKLAIETYVHLVECQEGRSLWFSTSGMGISWVHFRVDRRPKYYMYPNFRNEKIVSNDE